MEKLELKLKRFKGWRFSNSSVVLVAFFMVLGTLNLTVQAEGKHWVGTWGCAPYKAQNNTPPSPGLTNNTLRQIVRVSIGGDTLRVKFSNITNPNTITIQSVNIAVSKGGSTIDASTIKELKFKSNASVTIPAKSAVTSDPVAFDLTPSMRLAITIYYGQFQSSADMTFHYGSRTDSYILTGDKTTSSDFSSATKVERWYTINAIEVWAPETAAAVVALGNSITDGYGLTGGLQNRWTDVFSEKLLANPATQGVGVLNMGIGGTNVTSASNGAVSAVDRFEQDVLNQSGVSWVIIFYGINDIGANVSSNAIISGLKTMAAAAHAKNIKVYGATITPFNGYNNYYTAAHEKVRSDINAWIRSSDEYDGVIDFDKAVRDPNDTTKFQQALKNDWLHPNVEGYKAIGQSVDLKMFVLEKPDNVADHKSKTAGMINAKHCKGTSMIKFEIPHDGFVSLKVYSLLGKEITELAGRKFCSGMHSIDFKNKGLAKGIYFYTLKVDKISSRQIMVY